MSTIRDFTELDIWKLARITCQKVHGLKANITVAKDYALYDQMNRSSGSVMDNIAEGFERNGNKEFIHFLSIAKASCGELRSQIFRCLDRQYIDKPDFEILVNETEILGKRIGSFMHYLKNSPLKGTKF